MQTWQTHVVRDAVCKDCNAAFPITLGELVSKLDCGMHLPKRCPACRQARRKNPDPYLGLRGAFARYPATAGHRHQVHGGY